MLFYQVLSAYYVTKIVGNDYETCDSSFNGQISRRQMLMLDGKTIPELDDYFRYARYTFENIGCT